MTPKEVLAQIRQREVTTVDLRFMDFPGVWQHFSIPADSLTEETFEERYQASIDPATVELFGKRQGEMPRENLGPDLHKLKAKLLAIWGMDDRFGALDVGLQITRTVPDGQMHIFTRCGHWAQVEHAAEFNRLVVDFLAN